MLPIFIEKTYKHKKGRKIRPNVGKEGKDVIWQGIANQCLKKATMHRQLVVQYCRTFLGTS